MTRWFLLSAAAVLLAGCVSYPSYSSYDDGYYRSDSGYYDDAGYAGGSTNYSAASYGDGDYYYGEASYGYSNYVDYPYYYSLFYPLRRWSVDPYWHPGFYYGVTYYPRSYFSIGFSNYGRNSGYGYGSFYRPYGYSYFAYSPYRLAWVDNYYDWSRSHYRNNYHDNGWYAPRYGNARNEASWLSRQSRFQSYSSGSDNYRQNRYDNQGLPNTRTSRYEDRSRDAAIDRRQSARGADYGRSNRNVDNGRSASGRADPGVSGFGYRDDARSSRNADSQRSTSTRNARAASDGRQSPRSTPSQSERGRYVGDSGDVRSVRQNVRQAETGVSTARSPTTSRSSRTTRGYSPDAGAVDARSTPRDSDYRSTPRAAETRGNSEGYTLPRNSRSASSYSQPEPRSRAAESYRSEPRGAVEPSYTPRESRSVESRSYAPRGRVEAPVRSYEPRQSSSRQPEQRSYSEPAPRQSSAPQDRSYAAPERSEPRAERSRSERSASRGEGRSRDSGDDED